DGLAAYCGDNHIDCFRGHETDVLDRFYQAARSFGGSVLVRITADCPLIDPEIIDRVLEAFETDAYDYVTNTLRYTYPDGLDTEAFTFEALHQAWREATKPSEREHVTPYLQLSGKFRVHNVENDVDLSGYHYRWTVDDPSDLEFVRQVYRQLAAQPDF